MVNTDRQLATRVRRMVSGTRGTFRVAAPGGFHGAARSPENAGVTVLALPFDQLTPFAADTLHWLWGWEGNAAPFLVARRDSEGAALMERLAPGSARMCPPGLPVQPRAADALQWLPIKSLSLPALIAISRVPTRQPQGVCA